MRILCLDASLLVIWAAVLSRALVRFDFACARDELFFIMFLLRYDLKRTKCGGTNGVCHRGRRVYDFCYWDASVDASSCPQHVLGTSFRCLSFARSGTARSGCFELIEY